MATNNKDKNLVSLSVGVDVNAFKKQTQELTRLMENAVKKLNSSLASIGNIKTKSFRDTSTMIGKTAQFSPVVEEVVKRTGNKEIVKSIQTQYGESGENAYIRDEEGNWVEAEGKKLLAMQQKIYTTTKNIKTGEEKLTTTIVNSKQVQTDAGIKWANINNITNEEVIKSADNLSDNVNKNADKMENDISRIGLTATYVMKGVVRSVTRMIFNVSSAGSQLTELQSRFNRMLGDSASEMEAFAQKVSDAYGTNIATIQDAIIRMKTLADNAGIATSEANVLTKQMTILAAELSSVWDISTEESMNAIISGLQDLPKSLKKFGIYAQNYNAVELLNDYYKALGQNVTVTNGNITQQQKTLAKFLVIMKQAGYAIGDFADTEYTVANQTRILNASILGIQQNLGVVLNTAIGPLLKALNYIVKGIEKFTEKLKNSSPVFRWIVSVFVTLTVVIPIVVMAVQVLRVYMAKLRKSMEETNISTGKFSKSLTKVLSASIGVMIAVIGLIGLFSSISNETDKATNSTNELTKAYDTMSSSLASFDDINTLSKTSSLGIDAGDLKDIMEALELTTVDIDEMASSFEDLAKKADYFAYALISIGSAWAILSIVNMTKGLKNLFKTFSTGAAAVAGLVVAITAINTFVSLIKTIIENASKMNVGQWILGIVSAVWLLVGAIAALKGMVTGNWALVGIGAALTGMGIGGVAILNSTLPQMATGGVVTGPTVSMVGEGKYDEAVIPLGSSPQFASMKEEIADAVLTGIRGSGTSANGQPIRVVVNVGGEKVDDFVYKTYNNQRRKYET